MKQLPDKIKRRIAALRKMAADSSSENEAMIASRQLFMLMAKYGIDEFELEEDGAEIKTDRMDYDHKTQGLWTGIIAKNVSALYFCHCYQSTNGRKGKDLKRFYHITGSNNYRGAAIMITKAVIQAVDLASRQLCAGRLEHTDPWAFICSFRIAAAVRISARCQEMIAEACKGEMKDDDGTNLPVLQPMYDREEKAIKSFLDGNGLKLGENRQKAAQSAQEGTQAGRAFGNGVNLRQSIGQTHSQLRLK